MVRMNECERREARTCVAQGDCRIASMLWDGSRASANEVV